MNFEGIITQKTLKIQKDSCSAARIFKFLLQAGRGLLTNRQLIENLFVMPAAFDMIINKLKLL